MRNERGLKRSSDKNSNVRFALPCFSIIRDERNSLRDIFLASKKTTQIRRQRVKLHEKLDRFRLAIVHQQKSFRLTLGRESFPLNVTPKSTTQNEETHSRYVPRSFLRKRNDDEQEKKKKKTKERRKKGKDASHLLVAN